MLSLDSKKWAGFRIGDLFTISPGKRLRKEDMTPGNKPFIGASDSNNGITAFVSNSNASEDSNVLGVNYDGSVVESFYHPYMCLFSDSVKRFKLKEHPGNKYIYLFMKTMILQQKVKYGYGYKFSEQRMQRQIIMLPVDENGKPDYAFMEEYMREREQNLIHEQIAHVRAKITGDYEPLTLEGKRWGKFEVGDLFTVRIGKSIDGNKIDKLTGSTPYITRKERDNGLDGFTDQPEEYINANYPVITIGNETAEPFVQDFPFFTGTKVNILTPKTPQTRQALLFVAQSLRVHKAKYSYAFTINSTRLTKQVMQLPVDDSGRPDWEFMDAYMRAIEQKKLRDYLSYLVAKAQNNNSS